MESSSWQQEHMEKHRVLATARCRTLFFYSHSGSEKTRTFRFCLHSRTENPKKLIQGCTRPGTERLISDISDPDRQETERLSNVMNRNVLVRNVILSAMERTDPERLGNRRWHGTEQKNGTGAQPGSNRPGTIHFLYAARPQKTITGPATV